MWRIIEEFPNYLIDEYGNIFKVHGKRKYIMMKPLYIGLRNDAGRYFRRINQLVAKAYIKNPNNESIVNHIDGNKQNNHFTNLEWCDVAYNTKYSYEKLGRKGNHTADINCVLVVDDEIVGYFDNIKDAAEYASDNYGASRSYLIKNHKAKNIRIEKCND